MSPSLVSSDTSVLVLQVVIFSVGPHMVVPQSVLSVSSPLFPVRTPLTGLGPTQMTLLATLKAPFPNSHILVYWRLRLPNI